jgi:signal peptidase II
MTRESSNEKGFVIHHQIKKIAILLFFSFIAVVKYTALDLVLKWWVKSMLIVQPGYTISLTGFLDLVYSWNHGISFGMFQNYEYSNKIFIGIVSLIILYIWKLLLNSKSYPIYVGYSMILGGAMGNLADRVINGAVFDFISFHIGSFYFPIFNVADGLITIGAITVLYLHYRMAKKIAKAKEKEYDPIDAEAEKIRQMDREIAKKGIK